MDTVKINVENLLPAEAGYYTFSGITHHSALQ